LTQERARQWPRAMLATATHDMKRGEDGRLRIALLSELPLVWGRRVMLWLRLNRRHRAEIDGESVPDRNVESLFYQALVGAWPPRLDPGHTAGLAELAERVEAAMIKSVREGKERSSWSYPNAEYEPGSSGFSGGVPVPPGPNPSPTHSAVFTGWLRGRGGWPPWAKLVLSRASRTGPAIYRGARP